MDNQINYDELIKQAQRYLSGRKEAGTNKSPEGEGLPATDIPDATAKGTPAGAHESQPDAKATKQNMPDGENKKTKDQPESAQASGALEGNKGNTPSGIKENNSPEQVMSVNKRSETDKAAALAKDILSTIQTITSKAAGEMPPGLEKKEEKKEEHEKKETPATEKKEEKDEKKDEKKEEKKEAGSPEELSEMTRDLYAKIACEILSTDEGKEFVEKSLQKKAGEEAARAFILMNDNVVKEAQAWEEKNAAYIQGQMACDAVIDELQKAAAAKAAPAPQTKVDAIADTFRQAVAQKNAAAPAQPTREDILAYHRPILDQFKTDQEKVAYAMGAGLMNKLAEDGEVPEMGGDEDISIEDIVAALEMLVQEGTITQEDAEAVLQELVGGGAGGEAGAGAGGAEEAAMAAAMAGGAGGGLPPGMEAQASVNPAKAAQEAAKAAAAKITKK